MPENKNLYALLETRFKEAGNKLAFIEQNGSKTSYEDLITRVAAMTGALHELGVRPGDRVMVQVEKSIANVCLYLATLKLGAIYNPLNTAYTAHELDYFMSDAQPALLVVGADRHAAIGPIAEKHGVSAVTTLEADGNGALTQLAEKADWITDTAHSNDDDLAALVYTSGTTGRSKGAMITHKNLTSNAQVLHKHWGFQPDDVLLHALPIFHVHGLFVALHTAFLNGSTINWLPRFESDTVLTVLPQSTVMMGVPTFYTRLLTNPDFNKSRCANIRLFISGSAPMLAETHIEFEQRSGHRILERYGMTETGMITSNPYHEADGARLAGTVGFAIPGSDVRIAGDDGRVLDAGEVGILETKGPNVFSGYWRKPEMTAQEFRDDGYFITGDLAQMGTDGRITIVGRAKDLIISGGFNIYPKEIESELNEFETISETAVIGVPHPDFGEGVIALIVPERDCAPPGEKTVINKLRPRLAKFKLPKRVFVLKELPRNAMGKVQKNDLRSTYADVFASEP